MKRLFLLLLFLMVVGRAEGANLVRYVDTDVVGGAGDGTSWANAYATLAACEDAEDGVAYGAGETLTVYCRGTAADTTPVIFAGWDADVTVNVIGDAHTGIYDTGHYRLEVTVSSSDTGALSGSGKISIKNINVKLSISAGRSRCFGIMVDNPNASVIENCIVRGGTFDSGADGARGIRVVSGNSGSWNAKVRNNVVYGMKQTGTAGAFYGIDLVASDYRSLTVEVDNNSVYNCDYNLYTAEGSDATLTVSSSRNNVCLGGIVADFYFHANATFSANNYNCSSDTSATGAQSLTGKTASNMFTDAANGDLRLKTGSDCIAAGVDLSGSFTTDITGVTRSIPWDMGAFLSAGGATTKSSIIILGE